MSSEMPAEVKRSSAWSRAGWVALCLALLACLVGAMTFQPETWPGFVGDEATYLMAAQSLAYDFDLRYEATDLARFERLTGRAPEGLILQSPDTGKNLYYSKPALYPLWIAPFVRVGGHRGALFANALVLVLAALATALALRTWVGSYAGWYVLIAIFGSTTFLQVFWLHSDLLLAGLVAVAYALILRRPPDRHHQSAHPPWTWIVAGAAVAAVIASRPVYAPLVLPLVVSAVWSGGSRAQRLRRMGCGVLGVASAAVLLMVAARGLQGSWNSYSTPRASFGSATGFPAHAADSAEDPSASTVAWLARLEERGGDAWFGGNKTLPFGFDFAEFRWNLLYLALGRHVGLLPYQAGALLLGLLALRFRRESWALVAAFVLVALAFVLLRPFNFWGGGGSIGNRYLLPAIPALWFCAARRIHWGWLVGIVAVAVVFVAPSWRQPRSFLLTSENTYRFASPAAQRWLPYETTQSHLKPAGTEDFILLSAGPGPSAEVWAKPLSRAVLPIAGEDGEVRELLVDSSLPNAHLLVAAKAPLRSVRLELQGSHGTSARVRLRKPRARHRMWWSEDRWLLYELDLGAGLIEAGLEGPQRIGLRWD